LDDAKEQRRRRWPQGGQGRCEGHKEAKVVAEDHKEAKVVAVGHKEAKPRSLPRATRRPRSLPRATRIPIVVAEGYWEVTAGIIDY
jgi:hypothetical protein